MKLYTKCKQCKQEVHFTFSGSDRFQLARKLGKEIFLDCKSCGTRSSYEPNEISAEESTRIDFIATIILIGGTIALFMLVWKYITRTNDIWVIANFAAVLGTPFLIYQAISKSQRDRVRYFNTKQYG